MSFIGVTYEFSDTTNLLSLFQHHPPHLLVSSFQNQKIKRLGKT